MIVAVDTLAQARDELKAARASGGTAPICQWVERWADGLLDAAADRPDTKKSLRYWASLVAEAHDGLRATTDADKRARGALALGRLRESLIVAARERTP